MRYIAAKEATSLVEGGRAGCREEGGVGGAGAASDVVVVTGTRVYWLYWYKRPSADAAHPQASSNHLRSLLGVLALLVQKCKYCRKY